MERVKRSARVPVPFLSAAVNLVHHLCLEGKLAGAGHNNLLLATGRARNGLLVCLHFLPLGSVHCGPAEVVISPCWQFVSDVKALLYRDAGRLLHRLLALMSGTSLSQAVTYGC